MKKKIIALFVAIGIIGAGAAGMNLLTSASAADISLEASAGTVNKGGILDVRMVVSSDVSIGKFDSIIRYDDTILEYQSDHAEETAGATGTIHIVETFENGASYAEYHLKFKALEVGSCTFSMDETVIEEFGSANVLEVSSAPLTVSVETNDTLSSETRLSDLVIAPAELDETFSPDIYTYHATVSAEQLILSALPMDARAVVTVAMPETLALGSNLVKITVTAPSGDVSEYVIEVIRTDGGQEVMPIAVEPELIAPGLTGTQDIAPQSAGIEDIVPDSSDPEESEDADFEPAQTEENINEIDINIF